MSNLDEADAGYSTSSSVTGTSDADDSFHEEDPIEENEPFTEQSYNALLEEFNIFCGYHCYVWLYVLRRLHDDFNICCILFCFVKVPTMILCVTTGKLKKNILSIFWKAVGHVTLKKSGSYWIFCFRMNHVSDGK